MIAITALKMASAMARLMIVFCATAASASAKAA
jgi:hypothetical protein